MEPEQTQELSPEDAKASLGIASRLSEEYLMSQVPQEETMAEEAPIEPEIAPQEEVAEEPVEDEITKEASQEDPIKGLEERLGKKIDDLKEELKDEQMKTLDKEVTEIKKTLKDLSA